MAEDETEGEEKKGGGGTGKIIVLVIVGGLFVAATTAGAMFFMLKSMGAFNQGGGGGHQEVAKAEEPKPAIYHTLEPIVVNINDNGRMRFLQAKLDVMGRSQEAIDALVLHMPRIRNELVLLLSAQTVEDLGSPEGKERLRQEALKRIQAVLEKEIGEPGIEEVYITSLIVQ